MKRFTSAGVQGNVSSPAPGSRFCAKTETLTLD